MICTVIDDLFDQVYIHQIDALTKDIPLCTNNIANRSTYPFGTVGTHRLLGQILFNRDDINTITTLKPECDEFFRILKVIEKHLKAYFYCSQITMNVQHSGCDGTTHVDSPDPNDYTILLFTCGTWKQEWGGQFQLCTPDGEVVEEHEYIPGRVILVPSKHPHRGLGPTEPYVYRSSVAFRVTPLDHHLRKNYQGHDA